MAASGESSCRSNPASTMAWYSGASAAAAASMYSWWVA